MRRPVRLFSIVFNDQYIDWFERGCVRSLLWPKNRAALKAALGWDVWTTRADADRVREIAGRLGCPVELRAEILPASWEDKAALKPQLAAVLTAQMERCVAEGQAFLWAAPDNIFADGAVRSFVELAAARDVCVASAPLRVKAEGFIEAMGEGPLEGAALVRLGMERAHRSFLDAEATLPDTNSFESGLSWRRIGDGLYAITHRKQSAYLMQPTAADVWWFRKNPKFGGFDHGFPKLLVDEQRQRVIGSSDAAFVVELTTARAYVPPVMISDAGEPDRFNRDLSNYAANRNAVVIWRAA